MGEKSPISLSGVRILPPPQTRPSAAPFYETYGTVLAFPRKEGDGNRNDGGGVLPLPVGVCSLL